LGGEVITATSNHPFWELADQNWTEAGTLGLDDTLLNIQNKPTTIAELRSYKQNTIVYNLTVANDHTYYVGLGGVLGHNCDRWDRAVANLGITKLTYRDGTAYIGIGTAQNFHIRDIREVKKMMKALGNNKLEVNTGFLANEELLESISKKFKNNETFMGGTIKKANMGIGDFIIEFTL